MSDKEQMDTEFDQIDDELAQAMAEIEAEENGEEASKPEPEEEISEDGGAEETPVETQQEPEKPSEPEAESGATPMIPKPRFDEEVQRARQRAEEAERRAAEAERAAAYYQGKSEVQPKVAEPEPGPTPEEQINDVKSQIRDLRQKVDDGEMTMVEAFDAEEKMRDQIAEITAKAREAETAKTVDDKPKSLTEDDLNDALIRDFEDQLFRQVPELKEMWGWTGWDQYLTELTKTRMQSEGIKVDTGSLEGKKAIRIELAKTARAERQKLKSQTQTSGDAPTGDSKPETQRLSAEAQNRSDKHNLADRHPPDTSVVGGPGADEKTSERVFMSKKFYDMEDDVDLIDRMLEG